MMLNEIMLYAGGLVLLAGAAFVLVAAIGVIRLPDLYTRMHAASKAGAVGGGLILLAVALLAYDVAVAIRAVIGVIFLVLTTPLAAHLLARSGHLAGYEPISETVVDDITKNDEQNSKNK